MFCPRCRAEYRPGFTTCGDCQIELVERLPNTQGVILKEDATAGEFTLLETLDQFGAGQLTRQNESRVMIEAPVYVVLYDPTWPQKFDQEQAMLVIRSPRSS